MAKYRLVEESEMQTLIRQSICLDAATNLLNKARRDILCDYMIYVTDDVVNGRLEKYECKEE